MKVICFLPEGTDLSNYFHIELDSDEFPSVKPFLSPEDIESIQDIFLGDDDGKYRIFVAYKELSQHNHEFVVKPSFRAFPYSAMNNWTRVFLNKEIKELSEIRSFFIP